MTASIFDMATGVSAPWWVTAALRLRRAYRGRGGLAGVLLEQLVFPIDRQTDPDQKRLVAYLDPMHSSLLGCASIVDRLKATALQECGVELVIEVPQQDGEFDGKS